MPPGLPRMQGASGGVISHLAKPSPPSSWRKHAVAVSLRALLTWRRILSAPPSSQTHAGPCAVPARGLQRQLGALHFSMTKV